MELQALADTSRCVAETSRRLEKVTLLAEFLRRLEPEEIPIAISYLSGNLRQGKIGIGYAVLRDAGPCTSESCNPLTIIETDRLFEEIAAVSGPGSSAKRVRLVRELMSRATSEEQDFIQRLIVGELRQGSLEGIMIEALARAAGIPPEKMRSAAMLAGDLPLAGRIALQEGTAGLERFQIHVLRPFQPMLAQTARDTAEAIDALGTTALEYKMDGIRIQAHKLEDEVRLFSRNLNDVTEAAPEVSELLLKIQARSFILDGEVLALREDGTPFPFQITMQRFGRKLNIAEARRVIPLTPFFFDIIYLDDKPLLSLTERDRFAALQTIIPTPCLIPRIVTGSAAEAKEFLARARTAGHEGIMAKAPDSHYEPGIRSSNWLKVKPTHTLDLVILAAEWGHGRRRGRLSNLHLGARDPAGAGFVMLGKTFKGLTDAMLEWQTKRLLELEVSRDNWTVYVRPELVVEVAFNEIQSSTQYPAGMALRFARVKRYRTDKSADEADTIETVRALR